MKVKVQGLKELERRIEAAKKGLGLTAQEFADKAAVVLRDTVVRNAQPFGNGKKAQKRGENAILGDLVRCFKQVPDGARGRDVIRSEAAAASFHKSRRNSRGRVTEGKAKRIEVGIFRSYLGKLQARVGVAKASVSGGGQLGKGVGEWIKRNDRSGDAKRKRHRSGGEWTFTADPQHVAASNVLGERGVKKAMAKNTANLTKSLERDMKRKLKREEKLMNSTK